MIVGQAALNAGQPPPERAWIDFLMAFTYGFSSIPGQDGFFPGGTDPEVGLRKAAPHLGLKMRYQVTDDGELFLRAIRAALHTGRPVRLPLDMAQIYGAPGMVPHSAVIVGFRPDAVEYYETVGRPPAPLEPGAAPPGAPGLWASNESLLRAVAGVGKSFGWPWNYAMTTFVDGPTETDLRLVWKRIANATLGGNRYGPPTGVPVLDSLASALENGESSMAGPVREAIESAQHFRDENARFLAGRFAGEAKVVSAASYLAQAANTYAALAALPAETLTAAARHQAATLVRQAAAAERAFGLAARELAEANSTSP